MDADGSGAVGSVSVNGLLWPAGAGAIRVHSRSIAVAVLMLGVDETAVDLQQGGFETRPYDGPMCGIADGATRAKSEGRPGGVAGGVRHPLPTLPRPAREAVFAGGPGGEEAGGVAGSCDPMFGRRGPSVCVLCVRLRFQY